MEPEVRAFLQRISVTIFVGLLWMSINSTLGIMFNFAFYEDKPKIENIIFYIWLIASLTWMIRYYIRLWKKPIENINN